MRKWIIQDIALDEADNKLRKAIRKVDEVKAVEQTRVWEETKRKKYKQKISRAKRVHTGIIKEIEFSIEYMNTV